MFTNQEVYNIVALGAAIGPRLERGLSSALCFAGEEAGRKWLRKSSSPEANPYLIRNEVMLLRELASTGLVPTLHEESKTDGEGIVFDEFLMELLDNAASLGDYIVAAKEGKIPMKVLSRLFEGAVECLRRTAAMGIFHADAHEDNFIVVLTMKGKLEVRLIDWGWAFTSPEMSKKLSSLDDQWMSIQGYLAEDWGYVKPQSVEEVLRESKEFFVDLMEDATEQQEEEYLYYLNKAFI